ncbi:hypothetical protein AVEN_20515-1 [Araneus ventricosus]|uniref:Secreted protein n=1 Tax=Araneus ventricosus TaxID=182803 RepID=A0A4Y2VB51_ARAVE|nr:hypothetical protein AVEN_20515-1 [Araneus ventricosus]
MVYCQSLSVCFMLGLVLCVFCDGLVMSAMFVYVNIFVCCFHYGRSLNVAYGSFLTGKRTVDLNTDCIFADIRSLSILSSACWRGSLAAGPLSALHSTWVGRPSVDFAINQQV